ncbi:MAG: SUMF1/EgtB/PvdO family nonheme iron enzyme, partial [Maribacter sp.]|nr:SUMF1/EgtB/PvdO family nonheme iron enzyme [Maribacter sp.]
MKIQPKRITKFSYRIFLFFLVATATYSCKSSIATAEPAKEKSNSTTENVNEIYTETIPVANLSFDMVLVPEGEFLMGSPANEANRKEDEGPQKQVALDAFWMGKYEVKWREFELFFKQNQPLFESLEADKLNAIDAVTRPSPPY